MTGMEIRHGHRVAILFTVGVFVWKLTTLDPSLYLLLHCAG